ncbi:hypothetical protein [Dactylosporangium sp. CS-033363]|uniref:hypothetical protein n=1 Tax=Dactylosporangium sp. CS-033363 TaxID=3239935 RepID=UPI003D8E65D4
MTTDIRHWVVVYTDGTRSHGRGAIGVEDHQGRRRLRMVNVRPGSGRIDQWVTTCYLDHVRDWGVVAGPETVEVLRDELGHRLHIVGVDDEPRPPAEPLEGAEPSPAEPAPAGVALLGPPSSGEQFIRAFVARTNQVRRRMEPGGIPDDGTGGDARVWAREMADRDLAGAVSARQATWAQHVDAAAARVLAATDADELYDAQVDMAALMLLWAGVVRRPRSAGGGVDADRAA